MMEEALNAQRFQFEQTLAETKRQLAKSPPPTGGNGASELGGTSSHGASSPDLASVVARLEQLEAAGSNHDVTLHALRMRVEQVWGGVGWGGGALGSSHSPTSPFSFLHPCQMELVVFRPGADLGDAFHRTALESSGVGLFPGGGGSGAQGDAGLVARVAGLVKRDIAEEHERAYTELEVNRHIDTSRLESRMEEVGGKVAAFSERMEKLEENVISEQEHSLRLLDTILQRGA